MQRHLPQFAFGARVAGMALSVPAILALAGCALSGSARNSTADAPSVASNTPTKPTAPNQPPAPNTNPAANSQPQAALGGSIDPAGMELSSAFGAPRVVDPIVGNKDNIPSSFASTGAGAPAMALDVMESLAQVTYAKQGSDFDPSVSRDGQLLVFASTQHRPTADIYVKNITGRTVTQLTADPAQDVMPAISPDGQRVAFASNRSGSWDIYVMSIAGGQAVQVTSDPAQELHPSWSPDGTKIVYCRLGEISGRWEMWVTHIDQPMVSEFIGYGLFPSWCPVAGAGEDGRDKILFQRSRERGDRAFSVWTVDYKPGDASSPTEIANSATAACINPSWSADGTRVVFATVPFSNEQATNPAARPTVADLWMTGVDGSGRVNLTTGRSVNLMPSWGADNRIYFVSDRGGIENIWSIGTEKAIMAATGGKNMDGVGGPNNAMQTAHKSPAKGHAEQTPKDKKELTTVHEKEAGEQPEH